MTQVVLHYAHTFEIFMSKYNQWMLHGIVRWRDGMWCWMASWNSSEREKETESSRPETRELLLATLVPFLVSLFTSPFIRVAHANVKLLYTAFVCIYCSQYVVLHVCVGLELVRVSRYYLTEGNLSPTAETARSVIYTYSTWLYYFDAMVVYCCLSCVYCTCIGLVLPSFFRDIPSSNHASFEYVL